MRVAEQDVSLQRLGRWLIRCAPSTRAPGTAIEDEARARVHYHLHARRVAAETVGAGPWSSDGPARTPKTQ